MCTFGKIRFTLKNMKSLILLILPTLAYGQSWYDMQAIILKNHLFKCQEKIEKSIDESCEDFRSYAKTISPFGEIDKTKIVFGGAQDSLLEDVEQMQIKTSPKLKFKYSFSMNIQND